MKDNALHTLRRLAEAMQELRVDDIAEHSKNGNVAAVLDLLEALRIAVLFRDAADGAETVAGALLSCLAIAEDNGDMTAFRSLLHSWSDWLRSGPGCL